MQDKRGYFVHFYFIDVVWDSRFHLSQLINYVKNIKSKYNLNNLKGLHLVSMQKIENILNRMKNLYEKFI